MRSGRYTLAVVGLLTAAVCLRGASALRRQLSRAPSAVCCAVTRELFISGEGTFLRQELPLPGGGMGSYYAVSDGEKVPRGALLGAAWASDEERRQALARLDYALWRENETRQAEGVAPSGDPGEALRRYALLLRRGDVPELYPALRTLCAGVWESAAPLSSGECGGEEGLILAPVSGIFAAGEGEEDFGCLVTGNSFRFVSRLPEEAASVLTPGMTAGLDFAPLAGRKEGELTALSRDGEGVTAEFLCRCDPGDTLHLYSAPVRVVYGEEQGLSVPLSALREEDGSTFVWRLDGVGAEKAPVEVISRQETTALVRSDALRKGSRVDPG